MLLSVTTNWINANGGDFDTAANWDNGVPTAGVDAVIGITVSAPITKSSGAVDAFASLTSSDPVQLSGGTLDITGIAQLNSTLTLQGGTLKDATVTSGGAGELEVAAGMSGVLDNVTLYVNMNLSDTLFIQNNLSVNSTLNLENGTLNFENNGGAQTLGGSGVINV